MLQHIPLVLEGNEEWGGDEGHRHNQVIDGRVGDESTGNMLMEIIKAVPISAEAYERVRRRHVNDSLQSREAEIDEEMTCDVYSLRAFFVQLMCPSIGIE